MNRLLIYSLFGWLTFIAPVVACSRDNSMKVTSPASDSAGRKPSDTSGPIHTYLALGDSYTIATSIPVAGSYPVQTVQQLAAAGIQFADPVIVATNGWTTTNLLTELAMNEPVKTYDMVTLLIGVNNQYQGGSLDNYSVEFTELLKKSISYAGNRPSHVVVLSIPDYSVTPFGQGQQQSNIAAQIDAFNKVNKIITLACGAQYLYITDDTRAAGANQSLLANDGLHYTATEYAIWAKGLTSLFRSALGE